MRLVLDTNVVLKALIKDSVVRGILLHSEHEFLVPKHGLEETRKHLGVVAIKSGLSVQEIGSVLDIVLAGVETIPAAGASSKLREAEEAMSKIDPTDVPLVTAALSARCDGIWSDDKDLKRQDKVRVWTTKEVASLSRT
ncbi:MAG: hypothetical protein JRM82_00950 [Nitrososphaerota archaeon]|nr:hypothetical protein [Nitrososphaerota archaeon]